MTYEVKTPDLHRAGVIEKELFQDRKFSEVPQKQFIPAKSCEDFSCYKFRCSSYGRMMVGIPKPLTDKQHATYESYHNRFMGLGKPLTEKQELTYFDLGKKKRATVKLSDGGKSYIEDLVREDEYGRRNIIETKYMEKGLAQEVDSIALYSDFIGKPLTKNTERKENEFLTGECDNFDGDIVRDFKTSWDFTTFPLAATDIKTSLYEWQLQGYMELWDVEKAELIYCLVDSSIKHIEDDIRRLDWKYDILTFEGAVKEEHIPFIVERISNMIYTEEALKDFCDQSGTVEIEWFSGVFKTLPTAKRIKVFPLDRDRKMMRYAREMAKLARDYMNESKLRING